MLARSYFLITLIKCHNSLGSLFVQGTQKISEKTRSLWNFFVKGGGGLRISNFFTKKHSFFLISPLSDSVSEKVTRSPLSCSGQPKNISPGFRIKSQIETEQWSVKRNVWQFFRKLVPNNDNMLSPLSQKGIYR